MKMTVLFSLGLFFVLCIVVEPSLAQQKLASKYIAGEIPLNPMDEAWKEADPFVVDLHGQMIAAPLQPNPSVTSMTVKALNTRSEIAFLLVWEDKTENRFLSIDEFSDAVAIQVPYTPDPSTPFMMGGPGQRVLILHWTAFRQENIEHGYYDTAKAYPNYAYDWYPHAEPPYHYPEDWHNPYALDYIGGEKVLRKNTVETPVRELVAEGFGSSTWKDIQGADGNGVYKDGRWHVVIRREFVEESTSNPEWGTGKSTFINFAVWDGANNERGGRKSLEYAWTPLQIEIK